MAKESISYQEFRKLLAGTDCNLSSEWKDCKDKRGASKKKCASYVKKNCSPKKAKKASPKKVKKTSPKKSAKKVSPKRRSARKSRLRSPSPRRSASPVELVFQEESNKPITIKVKKGKKKVSKRHSSRRIRVGRESSIMREGVVYGPQRVAPLRESSVRRQMNAVVGPRRVSPLRESSVMRRLNAVRGSSRRASKRASGGKKCYDLKDYVDCNENQVCDSNSGKCKSKSKALSSRKSDMYILEMTDRPSIVGSKASLEAIKKNLGKGKISSIAEVGKAKKEAEEEPAVDLDEFAAELERDLSQRPSSKKSSKSSKRASSLKQLVNVKGLSLPKLSPQKRASLLAELEEEYKSPKKLSKRKSSKRASISPRRVSPARKPSLSPARVSEKGLKQREEIKKAFESCLATI